jgi:putative intracellular protease/amidase
MTDAPSFTHQSCEEAREQAAAYLGFVVSERITLPNGEVFEIPNPSLLDEDQQARYDQLQVESEDWDRHPDIPEVLNEDGVPEVLNEDGTVKTPGRAPTVRTPARRGNVKVPERKDDVLVNYNMRLAKAIFGERYDAFKAAGGRSSDVNLHWSRMNKALADRRAVDSKSAQGGSDLADSASADRG